MHGSIQIGRLRQSIATDAPEKGFGPGLLRIGN
jgi:hypothetical protein